jgi:hypothetical protein
MKRESRRNPYNVTIKCGSIIGSYTSLSKAEAVSLNTELNSNEESSDNDSSHESDWSLIWLLA